MPPSSDSPVQVVENLPSLQEQYMTLIEDIRALRDRRETLNNLFCGIISLLAGGQAYLLISQAGNIEGLIVAILATVFGVRLCKVWVDALGTYSLLLDMRYETLKIWERHYKFPSLRKYYVSEDLIYGDLKEPTDLSTEIKKIEPALVGRAKQFTSMYVSLPRVARFVFYSLASLQIAVYVSSQYGQTLWSFVTSHLMPILK